MKILLALLLLAVALYSVIGFLHAAEPGDPSDQMFWRVVYAVLGLGSLLGMLKLLLGKRGSAGDR